ncbi:hypothetical protein [Actinacidiphila sp. bgisy144]|uniref:hypothetical protein n=1 Tax=Actinacidiphila sp. bgisy144 TaxID=3413791 RepID=UPI003EB7C924
MLRPLHDAALAVTFQNNAPTEIVADFTTALAAAYTGGPNSYLHYGSSNLSALDLGTPLTAAGWNRHDSTDVSFHSPDGLAEVHLRRPHHDHTAEMTGHQRRWLMLAGPPGHRAIAGTPPPPPSPPKGW